MIVIKEFDVLLFDPKTQLLNIILFPLKNLNNSKYLRKWETSVLFLGVFFFKFDWRLFGIADF